MKTAKFIQLLLVIFLALTTVVGAASWSAPLSAAGLHVADRETIHVVQRGETLFSIARRYGVTVEALKRYNALTSNTIYVGQQLSIPTDAPIPVPTPPFTEPIIHVVQRGDTLFSIARRYGVTVQSIIDANLLPSTQIYVGQRLTILTTGGQQPTLYHTVQRGDTLFNIARRYGVTIAAIQTANRLPSTTIYIGQRLIIPGGTHPNPTPVPTPIPSPQPNTPERINFAPGATSATVRGTTTLANPRSYVLRAQAGQQMTINLATTGGAAYLAVHYPTVASAAAPSAAGGSAQSWTGSLPATGDYIIDVIPTSNGAVNFTLTVSVVSPNPRPTPGGNSSATVQSVDIRLLESYPVQVQAVIRGQLPSPCFFIREVIQQRSSRAFTLQIITSTYPDRLCAEVITPFEQVVALNVSGLPAGQYTVQAGNVVTAFNLP